MTQCTQRHGPQPSKAKNKICSLISTDFLVEFYSGFKSWPKKSSWLDIHTYSVTCLLWHLPLGSTASHDKLKQPLGHFYVLGRSCEQITEAGRRKSVFAPCSPVLPGGLLGVIILCKVLSDKGSGLKYYNKLSAGVPQGFRVMTLPEQTSPQLRLKYNSYLKNHGLADTSNSNTIESLILVIYIKSVKHC